MLEEIIGSVCRYSNEKIKITPIGNKLFLYRLFLNKYIVYIKTISETEDDNLLRSPRIPDELSMF